ncbi:MAG: C_GCAxxG_C_C family protein [Thermoplasmata archaeon]|nr:MAG: C_GCAxxG_C_C family protein [Thermoplasmata archaeon]
MDNSKVEDATKYFEGDLNCCQSMIMTYGPDYGLSKDTGIRLGTGFAGGMARHGEVCGAVTGAIMIIGLKFGMKEEDDSQARDKTYELVKEFLDRFKTKHESIRCRDLLECDIGTPEGRALANEKGLFKTLCPKLVKSAAEILEEQIL